MEKRTPVKVAVVGAESTGKTQICEALASHFKTLWVPEYAREYFHDSDIYNYTLKDLEQIAERQVMMEEEAALKTTNFLFCDTALITLKIWAELEFGQCPASILDLMQRNAYDFYLITNNEVPWEKDPLRQNKFSRDLIFQINKKEVELEKTPYGIIQGLGPVREKKAIELFQMFRAGELKG